MTFFLHFACRFKMCLNTLCGVAAQLRVHTVVFEQTQPLQETPARCCFCYFNSFSQKRCQEIVFSQRCSEMFCCACAEELRNNFLALQHGAVRRHKCEMGSAKKPKSKHVQTFTSSAWEFLFVDGSREDSGWSLMKKDGRAPSPFQSKECVPGLVDDFQPHSLKAVKSKRLPLLTQTELQCYISEKGWFIVSADVHQLCESLKAQPSKLLGLLDSAWFIYARNQIRFEEWKQGRRALEEKAIEAASSLYVRPPLPPPRPPLRVRLLLLLLPAGLFSAGLMKYYVSVPEAGPRPSR